MIKTDFIENPGPGTRYIVSKYTSQLVEAILKDVNEFALKTNLKERSLCQLYNLILCVENGIKPHTEKILKQIIYKLILDEEAPIAMRSYKICELLGLYVETDYILPMMISHLTDSESKNVPRFVSSCLTALSAVITHTTVRFSNQLESFMDNLLKLIISSDFLFSENIEVLEKTLRVTSNLIYAAGNINKKHQHQLFKILLQLGSLPQMAGYMDKVNQSMNTLAKSCGLEEGGDLFSVELSELIDEMQESYEGWNKHTPERFIFDMLVRRSNTALVERFEDILQIIAASVDSDKDYELRMDMLALVEFLLNQEILHVNIGFYSEIILKMILIPSTVWKVGKPNIKIRKAAVICMMRLLDHKLISKEKLYNSFKEMMGVLKNCMDDDWANDLRFAAVILIRRLIDYLHEVFDAEDYKEIYPELLKRLDDSQDSIRIATAETFCVFFKHLPDPWSTSLYEFTVKNIFIHLDDQNPDIQKAIQEVLVTAARVQTDKFFEVAEDQQQKFSHPVVIKALIERVREQYKK